MTSQETTATPFEGVGIGAATAITLYGLAVVVASLAGHEGKVLPHEDIMIAVVMIAVAIVGAVLGAGFERSRK